MDNIRSEKDIFHITKDIECFKEVDKVSGIPPIESPWSFHIEKFQI